MKKNLLLSMIALCCVACGNNGDKKSSTPAIEDFTYTVDKFADIEILRYRVPDFDSLTLQQKELVYYLTEAALAGRDILYDQNNKYNLAVRRTLESVYENYRGNRQSEDFANLTTYLKQVWMGNGIHHHYSTDKFTPHFSKDFFAEAVKNIDASLLPLSEGQTVDDLVAVLSPVIFDPAVYPKRVNQEDNVDLLLTSANNYYEGVTQKEAEDFYNKMRNPKDLTPISYGLNSKLVKENGQLVEKTYKIGGMYGPALEKIVYWLGEAVKVAENNQQRDVINTLIKYYQTGDLRTYNEYSIKWVEDVNSQVDFINGFTETYGDALGLKASWESIVNFKNVQATKRTELISANAQWFEDNAPIAPKYRKEEVKGITAKVITAAILGGDCYPATPIGVNLPNANWIRASHGSKSVTIDNITEAYNEVSLKSGFADEFMWSDTEREIAREYGSITDNLHTDLHECLGHASGKLLPGVSKDNLKAYASTIEEARADLFALYYIADSKIVELGLLPNDSAYKAEYYKFMMNGLMTQLTRIKPGNNIEEAHMRNRQLIASWVYEKGKPENVVEKRVKDGKTYMVINDYDKLRKLFGDLLFEVQHITSTGNFDAARKLVETYAVKVDPELHKEILDRYAKLNLAPYKGFVNPVYTLEKDKNGKVIDISLSYGEGYIEQQLRYSKNYSFLPTFN